MTNNNSHILSPQAAAKRAGCGRTTIMRALEVKELKGIRNNSNRWKISPEDLDIWSENRTVRQSHVVDTVRSETMVDIFEHHKALTSVAVLENKVDNLEVQLATQVNATAIERKRADLMFEQLTKPRWPWSRRIIVSSSKD